MKNKAFAAVAACLAWGMAHAQTTEDNASYGGAVAGLMQVSNDCAPNCDHRGKFMKLYVGTQISPSFFIEGAVMNFGKSQFNTSESAKAQAAALSLAYRQKLSQRFTLSGRVGLAYQQNTVEKIVVGKDQPEEQTSNKLQPILGLSAEYALTKRFSAVATADVTRVKLSSKAATIGAYGIGMSMNFDAK